MENKQAAQRERARKRHLRLRKSIKNKEIKKGNCRIELEGRSITKQKEIRRTKTRKYRANYVIS